MSECYYTPQHEWVRFDCGKAFVGLTGKGLKGDIVYIELPDIGQQVKKGQACASVEALKTVADVHTPIGGTVCGINDAVYDDPDIIANQPKQTWLFQVKYEGQPDLDGLMTEGEYEQM